MRKGRKKGKKPLFKSRKAQFFILSAVTIVSVLYFVSRWVEPFSIIDTSQSAMLEEPFLFNNIKEKAIETVNSSKSCRELRYNLEEFKNFVEGYTKTKNLIVFSYQFPAPCIENPPSPAVVEFNISLFSPKTKINDVFWLGWVPP
jgi:hypothetical protein